MPGTLCPVIIGREREIAVMEDGLLAAYGGQGRILMIAGEAGVGKTCLSMELQRLAKQGGFAVLAGASSEANTNLSYLPVIEAFGNYLLQVDTSRLERELGSAVRELARLFPQLELAPPPADPGDSAARLRLYEAVFSLLRWTADPKGTLLVIEDVHWSDASTLECLDYIARRIPNQRIVVAVTFRREDVGSQHPLIPFMERWRRLSNTALIELQPLTSANLSKMISAILDGDVVAAEFAEFIYRQTEGNPFVVEELLRAALDRGDIYHTAAGWKQKPIADVSLPRSLAQTIRLRVERVPADQAEILRTAAVLGATFDYDVLRAVLESEVDPIEAALQTFIQLQLIEEDRVIAGRYRFRHALTREAIYADILGPRRKRMHQRIAAVLRTLPGTRPAELAYHLMAAGQWDDAIPASIKAAEDAERQLGYREAAEHYQRVLAHLQDAFLRGQVLGALGNALYLAGDRAAAIPHLERGITALESRGEEVLAAHFRLILGRCYWEGAQPELARSEYEHARATLESQPPSEDLAVAYVRLAGLADFDFRKADALKMAEHGADVAVRAGAEAARIWANAWIGIALADLNRLDEGLRLLDASYQQAAELGLHWVASNTLANSVSVRLEHFRAAEALPLVDRSMTGIPYGDILAHFYKALILLALGEAESAEAIAREGLRLARSMEATTMLGWLESVHALTLAAANRVDEAEMMLARAHPVRERQDVILRTFASLRVRLAAGEIAEASREARALISTIDWSRSPVAQELQVLDAAVEALMQDGLNEDLLATARALDGLDLPDRNPYVERIQARLQLAAGQTAAAEARARYALEFFERFSYRDEAWRTRRLIAAIKLVVGDAAAADAELREMPPPPASVSLGERFVTVLYADVRGYTAIARESAPNQLSEQLGNYYRWARQEVERHHGLVELYAGDAVMATFNVTSMRLEHGIDALRAALALRDKAAFAGLPVGIGIATGPQVVGELSEGTKVTSVGDTANLAARLQAQAGAGEILLSEETFRRVRSWLAGSQGLSRNSLALKGFDTPVTAYRLEASNRAATSNRQAGR